MSKDEIDSMIHAMSKSIDEKDEEIKWQSNLIKWKSDLIISLEVRNRELQNLVKDLSDENDRLRELLELE